MTTPAVPTSWRAPVRHAGEIDRTFETTLQRFRRNKDASSETGRKYEPYIRVFAEWMLRAQKLAADDIAAKTTREDMEDYVYYLQQPHADDHPGGCFQECDSVPYATGSSGLKTKIAAISSFFSYCVTVGQRDNNPAHKLNLDTPPSKPGVILLPRQIHIAMQTAGEICLRDQVVTGAFFGMGLRGIDLRNANANGYKIHEDDEHGPRRTLKTVRKGRQPAELDVPYGLVPIFDAYLDGRTEGPLILPIRNYGLTPAETKPVAASTLFDIVKKVARHADLPPELGPHDGKRTATTLATTDPSATIPRLTLFFGHKDFNTTLGYVNTRGLPSGHLTSRYLIDWRTQGF